MDVLLPEDTVGSDCNSPITLITVSSSAESPMEMHDEPSIDAEQNISACPLLETSRKYHTKIVVLKQMKY